jgi:hypothetical protein
MIDWLTAHSGRTPLPPSRPPAWEVDCAKTDEERRAVVKRKKDFILRLVVGLY